jgi:IstB-like ATP binding protein
LIIDDLGRRKLPLTTTEDFLEIVMRRYQRVSTLVTSNRPIDDWGKLLGDAAAVTAMLDRLLHHGYVLKCVVPAVGEPRSEPTNTASLISPRQELANERSLRAKQKGAGQNPPGHFAF